jgi:transcriptional regulator with XRE-family HTH domain
MTVNQPGLRALLITCRKRYRAPEGEDGPRGRRAGISQEQLGFLLGRSGRWYGALERGEMDNPSTGLLEDVARALSMTDEERAALYLYAIGRQPETVHRTDAAADCDAAWRTVVSHVTAPAMVTDVRARAVAWNTEFREVFGTDWPSFAQTYGGDLLRWGLTHTPVRDRLLVDWADSWAPALLTALHVALARLPGDPGLRALQQQVAEDPLLGSEGAERFLSVYGPGTWRQTVRHPRHGPTTYTSLTASAHGSSGLALVVWLPEVAGGSAVTPVRDGARGP